jgi:hypothetical protein
LGVVLGTGGTLASVGFPPEERSALPESTGAGMPSADVLAGAGEEGPGEKGTRPEPEEAISGPVSLGASGAATMLAAGAVLGLDAVTGATGAFMLANAPAGAFPERIVWFSAGT